MNIDIAIDYRRALEVSCDSLTALQRDLLVAMCVAPENEVAAGLLAPLLGLTHHGRLNLAIVGLARKLAQAADVKPPTRKDGSPRWWQIVATGREAPDGRLFWKLRPALRDAAIACDLVPSEGVLFPDVVERGETDLLEGAVTRVVVNTYERNPLARARCIAHFGAACSVCGFDFGAFYGPDAAGVIHVHHLVPISKAGGIDYVIDPVRDLRPVCANCHVVLHRRNPPFTIEEVKTLVDRNQGGPTSGCS